MKKQPKKQPFNIILLGDPAAGKATHARVLRKKYHFYDLDMGHELRKIKHGTSNKQLKEILAKTLDQGKLTPTKIVREIFKQKITSIPKSRGILFDGTPKMVGEAKLVYKLLKQAGRAENVKVLYLSIPLEESVRRMDTRKEYFKGKYSKRADDNLQALKNRVKYYRKNIAEVRNFLSRMYDIKLVSTDGPTNAVSARIERALHELDKKQSRNR